MTAVASPVMPSGMSAGKMEENPLVKTVSPSCMVMCSGISLSMAPLLEIPSHISSPTGPSFRILALTVMPVFLKDLA